MGPRFVEFARGVYRAGRGAAALEETNAIYPSRRSRLGSIRGARFSRFPPHEKRALPERGLRKFEDEGLESLGLLALVSKHPLLPACSERTRGFPCA